MPQFSCEEGEGIASPCREKGTALNHLSGLGVWESAVGVSDAVNYLCLVATKFPDLWGVPRAGCHGSHGLNLAFRPQVDHP